MPTSNEMDANPLDEAKTIGIVNNVPGEVPQDYKIIVEDVLSDSEDEEKGSHSHNPTAYDGEPIVMFDGSISVVDASSEESDDHLKKVAKSDSIHIPVRKKLLICGACNDNHLRDETSQIDVQYHTDDEKMIKVPEVATTPHQKKRMDTGDEKMITVPKVTPTPDQKNRMKENRRRALEIRKGARRTEVKDVKPTAKRSLLPELLNVSPAHHVKNPYLKKTKKNMYRVNECSTRLIYKDCACRAAMYNQSWCPACHQKIYVGDCITKHQYWRHTECPIFVLGSPPEEKVIPWDLEESIKDGTKSTRDVVSSHISEHTTRDQAKAICDKDKDTISNRSTTDNRDNQQQGVSLVRGFILPDEYQSHAI